MRDSQPPQVGKAGVAPLENPSGLYVHVPFCRKKCPYCHFYSLPIEDDLLKIWREGLRQEARIYASPGLSFDTLYFGGGTPSLLRPEMIGDVRAMLENAFRLEIREFTMEANPDIHDQSVLSGWKDAGVTRLSVGIQSFDDRILKTLGRGYSASDAANFVRKARAAGFDDIGLDVMIGIPGEDKETADSFVRHIDLLKPDHVSLYIMEHLEGLPFEAVCQKNPPDEDFTADVYDRMRDEMESRGLLQYEISNFSRTGRECRHNLKYWQYDFFLGLGPSASSHLGNRRWSHISDIRDWARSLERGKPALAENIDLSPDKGLKEALISGLRLVQGIKPSEFRRRFGVDILERYETVLRDLERGGWITIGNDSIRIPRDKLLLSNIVFVRFI